MVYKPNVLILHETWLQPNSHDFTKIDGYIATHCVRSINNNVGVSLFIDKNLNATKLDFMTRCDVNIETCANKLRICLIQYHSVAIYRPHSGNVLNFVLP